MSTLINDGTSESPKLQVYLTLGTLAGLPPWSFWPGLQGRDMLAKLKEDGFDGVQGEIGVTDGLIGRCGMGRINAPAEADTLVARHRDLGDTALTVHVAWGLEDDDEMDAYVDAILAASQDHGVPVFIETHRATLTQDIWRTVQLTRRRPAIRFNGDFSHYYCGHEMVYGDFEAKLDFMAPIFERTGFLHGRIASSGWMQAPIEGLDRKPCWALGHDYLAHFKEIWIRAMAGFLSMAGPGDILIFAPELLDGGNYYARLFPREDGSLDEECDRYAQAILYKDIAQVCFASAQARVRSTGAVTP